MFERMPVIRSYCLVAVTAASVALLSCALAQDRDARRSVAVAIGQPASPPALNPRHPERYVVQRGDTLWDIAATFLRDPWYWPEIWQINPQVENPHLIFPGDILSLVYLDDGRPVLQVERGGGIERLSPRVRAYPLEEAISTIPYETLRAFLTRPAILNEDELEELPYIVAQRDGLMGSAGRDVYVRNTEAGVGETFNVVHLGKPLVDPDDDAVLGYEGIYIGSGGISRTGDPATLHLEESAREALVGDYLLQETEPPPFTFFPRAPDEEIDGRIISVVDGVSLIGQYQVITINRGERHGMEAGHVLRIYQTGEVITDPVRGRKLFTEKVRLPDEPAGTMMVFRTFDRMSYALVMEATNDIAVLDTVRNP
jgi:hypothetical protein